MTVIRYLNSDNADLNANAIIDIIKDTPIDLFAKCGHCRKVIIVSRAGKKYHSGCAAKAIQKAFWKKKDIKF